MVYLNSTDCNLQITNLNVFHFNSRTCICYTQFYITVGFHIGGMRKFKSVRINVLLDNSSELFFKIIITKKILTI